MDKEKEVLEKSQRSLLQPALSVNNGSSKLEEYGVAPGSKRSALTQIWMGLIANFTCIAPSMSLGFSAIVLPYLLAEDNPHKLTASQGSWVASSAAIATPFGCFMVGPMLDRFGRKFSFQFVHMVACAGWVIIAISYNIPEHQYPILLIGRLITGLSTGLSSMPASVYIAEVSSPKLRGMFTTWTAVFFSIGLLAVYFLGYINKENWFLTSVISAIVPLIGIILTQIFIIESPAWLIGRGKSGQAKKNMCRLFSTKEYTPKVQEEINVIITSKEKAQAEIAAKFAKMENPSKIAVIISNLKYFTGRTVLKPFVLMLIFFFFQQFSGIFVIMFYAVSIAVDAGVTIDGFIAAILIALTRLIASISLGFITKSYGRRPPSVISGAGMTLSMVLLGCYVLAKSEGYITPETAIKFSWFPMALLLSFLLTSTLGFLVMPFAMTAELFPARIRGTASGILTCIGYTFNFIVVKFYPDMVASMETYGVFFFYGAISLIGTVFVIVFLPETKGKTLQEIEKYFGRRKTKKGTYTSTEKSDFDTSEV